MKESNTENILATPVQYKETKVGPPFDVLSTEVIPDHLKTYRKIEELIPGDGSGVGTLDGNPVFESDETTTRDESCQCSWVQSNIATVPFSIELSGVKHGVCVVSRHGRNHYGDLDMRSRLCSVNIDDTRIQTPVFRYLIGNCDLPMEKRSSCSAKQENMLSYASIGICMQGETFGYTALRNGRITCLTAPKDKSAIEQTCSGYSYIPIGEAYCLPPAVRA